LVILPSQGFSAITASDDNRVGGFDNNLPIMGFGFIQSLFAYDFEFIRWGGSTQPFTLLVGQIMGRPFLIGIGDFLEVLWADLVVLING
jgi:hypothetical protein